MSLKKSNVNKKNASSTNLSMPREKVESVNRALNILKIIGEAKSFGLSAADLQRRTGIPKSSLSYVLRTLLNNEFLSFDEETRRYTVGKQILSLGAEILKDIRQVWESIDVPRAEILRGEVFKSLQKLAHHTKLVSLCGVLHHESLLFIESCEPTALIKTTILPGERQIPYKSAFGKILMSYSNENQFYRIMERYPVDKVGTRKYDNHFQLRKDLQEAKTVGYAIDDDNQQNIRSIASPVLSAHSDAIAAIGVIGTVEQISDFRFISNLIKTEAQSLSVQLRTDKNLDVKTATGILQIPTRTNVEEGIKTRVKGIQQQLNRLRREKHLTQHELAGRVGVSQSLIAKIESGSVNNVDLRTLISIVLALGNDLDIRIKS